MFASKLSLKFVSTEILFLSDFFAFIVRVCWMLCSSGRKPEYALSLVWVAFFALSGCTLGVFGFSLWFLSNWRAVVRGEIVLVVIISRYAGGVVCRGVVVKTMGFEGVVDVNFGSMKLTLGVPVGEKLGGVCLG